MVLYIHRKNFTTSKSLTLANADRSLSRGSILALAIRWMDRRSMRVADQLSAPWIQFRIRKLIFPNSISAPVNLVAISVWHSPIANSRSFPRARGWYKYVRVLTIHNSISSCFFPHVKCVNFRAGSMRWYITPDLHFPKILFTGDFFSPENIPQSGIREGITSLGLTRGKVSF